VGEKLKGLLAGMIFRLIALLTLGQISPILSACIIIERDGKLLLLDRSDGLGYAIPGGIVRYRETLEQCILREAREETGYNVAIHSIVGVYSSLKRDPRLRAISVAYKGSIIDGEEHGSKEGQTCWLTPGEIFGHMAFDGELMLKDYLSGYQRLS
jgi:ADP-ribose pyrophosphatase YjhB (NUDIX family)